MDNEIKVEEILEELDNISGLKNVKKVIRERADFLKIIKL